MEEYVWHPTEERILIKDVFHNGVNNYTVYYVSQDYIVVENSTGNYTEKYIYQDGFLVAQVNTNGNKEFVHGDHEGSNVVLTNANGNVIENSFYSPFQEIIEGGRQSRFDGEAKEYDSVVEDYDFHFRKYKPQWGKFTQPDTLIQNVYDPQLLNRYAFERNNPQKYVDPDGHGLIRWGIRLFERFFKDVAKDYSISTVTDYHHDEYEKYVPEEKQSQLAEDIYLATRYGERATTATKAGIIIQTGTRHAYRKNIYKTVDTISDVGLVAELALIIYYRVVSDYYFFQSALNQNSIQESNKAKENTASSSGNRGGGKRSKSAGTNTLGSNSISDVIAQAGGSTLKDAQQRAASESIAASIIARQRAKA